MPGRVLNPPDRTRLFQCSSRSAPRRRPGRSTARTPAARRAGTRPSSRRSGSATAIPARCRRPRPWRTGTSLRALWAVSSRPQSRRRNAGAVLRSATRRSSTVTVWSASARRPHSIAQRHHARRADPGTPTDPTSTRPSYANGANGPRPQQHRKRAIPLSRPRALAPIKPTRRAGALPLSPIPIATAPREGRQARRHAPTPRRYRPSHACLGVSPAYGHVRARSRPRTSSGLSSGGVAAPAAKQ